MAALGSGSGRTDTPGTEWREPPSPLRVLVSCGWLTDDDSRDPRVRVEQVTSSHAIFRVTAPDGRVTVVKHVPQVAAAAGRSLRRELFVYRLARWIPALSAALPRAALIDEHRQSLVLEWLGPSGAWPSHDGGQSFARRGEAERLSGLMAGWHAATADLALWPTPAIGVLHLPDHLDTASQGRAHATRLLMQAIARDQELAGALRGALAGWRDRCLVHGDLRRENWIATARARRLELKVLDWELSGSGDPAWDVASVVAELALDAIRAGRDPAGGWTGAEARRARAVLHAYAAAGGLLALGEPAVRRHVVLCTVSRLLHVACEWAEMQQDAGDGPASAVLARARALLSWDLGG